jgi:hypothetical protein
MSPRNQPAIHNAGEGTEKPHPTSNLVLVALSFGCITALLGAAVQIITSYYFTGTLISDFADDLIIGTVAGLLVFFYERQRNRRLVERLRIIEEMNHHVRNALEVVSSSAYLQQDQELRTMLRESSERIEWALREILPGKIA